MHLWGQSYITAVNLVSFLSFPPTIILLIIIIITISIYVLINITCIVNYYHSEILRKKPSLIRILFFGFTKALRCILTGNIILPFFAILMFIMTNIPLIVGILLRIRIPNVLFNAAYDDIYLKTLIILSLFLIVFITFRGVFVLPFCINEHQGFRKGINSSKNLLKGRTIKTAFSLMLLNLIAALCFFLFYFTVLVIAALVIFLFTEKSMVIAVFLSQYGNINFFVGIIVSMLALITNLYYISSMYHKYRMEDNCGSVLDEASLEKQLPHLQNVRHKIAFIGIILFFIIFNLNNIYQVLNNNAFYLGEALAGIQISSHRGNSVMAPENTIPAIESAIEELADYAEIDIQQTKDGVVVLLHDRDLWRTTGVGENIWVLNYAQVKDLDAGSWFSNTFDNARIPTLEEVLSLCKGRIKLNIHIKINGHEQDLEEKLLELIEKYDFKYQCVITSTSYATLVRIKKLNPDIKTGYIMSVVYGNFYTKEYIDFFSIKSSFITKNVVESAHDIGKEVHAWTVNSTNEIERMKTLGVDVIITDNPVHTREVLLRDDSNQTFIELLNVMLKSKQ